jgi:iron complex outermembrane recepter protein
MKFTKSASGLRRASLHPMAVAMASVGLVGLIAPTSVWAQEAPPAEDAAADDAGEIIVTARRSAENLQDVPVSEQVVSGAQIQKLAITSVEEVSKLAPGLTLVNNGSNTTVVLRGVTWQPGSGTPATPIYLNEVPFDPAQVIVSLYDVGQIEVLRGPQGTTRGGGSVGVVGARPRSRAR